MNWNSLSEHIVTVNGQSEMSLVQDNLEANFYNVCNSVHKEIQK
jgi:hypothetical protein